MKESYCGLCDRCELGSPDFQTAVFTIKTSMDRLPPFWQRQCLQEGQGFSRRSCAGAWTGSWGWPTVPAARRPAV